MLPNNPTTQDVIKEVLKRVTEEKATIQNEIDFILYAVLIEAGEKGFDFTKGLSELETLSKEVESAVNGQNTLDKEKQ
jgi:uncharacterized protein (UPF0335 family)